MAGIAVHVPWYATLFRGDDLERALVEIAPVALRYGATGWVLHRYSDDTYKFDHVSVMSKTDFETFWYGDEFVDWRAEYHGLYQVPIVYAPAYVIGTGQLAPTVANGS